MGRLRAAVAGAGLMGRWHVRYAERAGAEVAAIVDPDGDAARLLGRRHPGAATFPDLGAALAAGPVDVVHVCTPSDSHAALARAAFEHGAHVVVEKPAAATRAEAESLVALARERRRLLVPAHQMPFQRGVRLLRDRLPDLGELVSVEFRICSAGGEGRDAAGRRTVLLEMLPHADSLLRSLLGARYVPDGLSVLTDTADDLVLAAAADGLRIEVALSLRGRPPRNELQVTGTRGSGLADLFHGYSVVHGASTSRGAKALRPLVHAGQALAASSVNLARRAAGREPAYPGLRSLLAAAYESMRSGSPGPVTDEEIVEGVSLMERVRAGRRP